MTGAALERIWIYPIKSLDGVEVDAARVTTGGGLQHDRRFAMRDGAGHVVNAKRTAKIHPIRTRFDLERGTVDAWRSDRDGAPRTFHLDADRAALAAWLSAQIEIPLELDEDTSGGFPDDREASGPTVVSSASLEAVAAWFCDRTVDELRRRFRVNLEVSGVPAFWEDGFLGPDVASGRAFRIGDVELVGAKPCTRCVVPTRDPRSGEVWKGFAKRFSEERARTLPDDAERGRFDHFWRFTLNTVVPDGQAGRVMQVGNPIT